MLKKLLILLGIFLLLVTGVAFAEDNITVLINGEPLVTDVAPCDLPVYNENGEYVGDRVMVPLRAVGEALNCDVKWSDEIEGITIYRKGTLSLMWIGKEAAFLMESPAISDCYLMDVPPTLMDDRTMVPVRAVSELFGAEVTWIEESNTVSISYDLGEMEENAGAAESLEYYNMFAYENYDFYEGYFKETLETVKGKIILEDEREISFSLYPQIAPKTCERFINCAKEGLYDGTMFHRVIAGFVAQGGGMDVNMNSTDTEEKYTSLPGEFLANGHINLLAHKRGILSFARTNEPDGGSTQFFIVHQDTPHLDAYYASFGKVTEGMDVVDQICSAETDENDMPVQPIVVKTVVIDDVIK